MHIEISNTTADKATTDRLGQLLGEEDPALFAKIEEVIGAVEWVNLRLVPFGGGFSRVATFFGQHVDGADSPTKAVMIMQDSNDDDDFYASRDALLALLKKLRVHPLGLRIDIEPGGRLFDNEEPIPGRKPDLAPPPAEPILQASQVPPEIHVHIHLHAS